MTAVVRVPELEPAGTAVVGPPRRSFGSKLAGKIGSSTLTAVVLVVAMLWIGVFALTRVYESRRMEGRIRELQLILRAHGIALLLFVALTYLFDEYRYSRLVMLYFGLLGGAALVVYRLALRSVLRALRVRGFNLRNVLAVGEGPTLERLIRRLDTFG